MLSQPKHIYSVASQRVNHTLQYEVQQGDERVAEQRNQVYHLKEKVETTINKLSVTLCCSAYISILKNASTPLLFWVKRPQRSHSHLTLQD